MPNARAVGVEAIARRALANGQLVADSLAPSLGCGPPIYALLLGGDLEGGDPWGAPGPLTVALRTAAMLGEPSAARSRLAEAATLLENTPHTLEGSKGAPASGTVVAHQRAKGRKPWGARSGRGVVGTHALAWRFWEPRDPLADGRLHAQDQPRPATQQNGLRGEFQRMCRCLRLTVGQGLVPVPVSALHRQKALRPSGVTPATVRPPPAGWGWERLRDGLGRVACWVTKAAGASVIQTEAPASGTGRFPSLAEVGKRPLCVLDRNL